MTRVSVAFEDVGPETLAQIFAILGASPLDIPVTVDGKPLNPNGNTDAPLQVDWDAETARRFVDGLTVQAFKVLSLVTDGNGAVSLDDAITTLGLKSGKALGGVMSSFGHNIRLLQKDGRLPPDTRVVERDDETRQFHAVVPGRVLRLLTTAVARRTRLDATRSNGNGPRAVSAA
jgi:hypothetical protein